MEVLQQRTSSDLNPNAPMFIPRMYQTVEDYSEQWWELVRSSTWFRDYWVQHCFQDPQNIDQTAFLPEIDAVFDGYNEKKGDVEERDDSPKELVILGAGKWRKPKLLERRCFEKVPKIVNVKLSPRPIQQPRCCGRPGSKHAYSLWTMLNLSQPIQ